MAETDQPGPVHLSELSVSHLQELPGAAVSEVYSKCPICAKHVLSRSSFMEHMAAEHDGHLIAVCKVCRQPFSTGSIQEHIVRCKGPFVCVYCHATFACSSYLHRHINRKHSISIRPNCDTCGKSFSSASALSCHKRIHAGTSRYPCKLCGASFSQNCNLKTHIDSHHAYVELRESTKPFSCGTCGRGFLFACSLQNHRLQHLKFPKNLPCPICARCFSFRSELERHLGTHSRQRTNQCPFCLRLFSKQSSLKSHMLRHVFPDVLTCPYCLRIFSSRSYLFQHMKKHEPRLPGLRQTVDHCRLLLTEDCTSQTLDQKTSFDEALLDKFDDILLESTAQSDVNLLHAILYENDLSCNQNIGLEESKTVDHSQD